ncbi:methyltransferase [Micrococcales bacterium 31B]|nr:methyltransferase [Micrococcales bacterium 31B]
MVDVTSHYFSPDPSADATRRTLSVSLAGRTVEVATASNMFSPQQIDKGTAILLRHEASLNAVPAAGALLDAGCGWGPIALTLALLRPGATVYAIDVNPLALEVCAENAKRLSLENVIACTPGDVPAQVSFAAIWSNPPIRVGKAVLHDMLSTWLPRMQPGGHADLVVQKNLGADSLQAWIARELGLPTTRLSSSKGYRILRTQAAP